MKTAVLVSGGGTNLQAIIDGVEDGTIKNVSLELVVSNKANVYALERAEKAGIPSEVLSPKEFGERSEFNDALLKLMRKYKIELIVLAGYLVIIPRNLVVAYPNRIVNIHPSLDVYKRQGQSSCNFTGKRSWDAGLQWRNYRNWGVCIGPD